MIGHSLGRMGCYQPMHLSIRGGPHTNCSSNWAHTRAHTDTHHAWLVDVVVWIEEVAVCFVLLVLAVSHHLDVLPLFTCQPCHRMGPLCYHTAPHHGNHTIIHPISPKYRSLLCTHASTLRTRCRSLLCTHASTLRTLCTRGV